MGVPWRNCDLILSLALRMGLYMPAPIGENLSCTNFLMDGDNSWSRGVFC